VRFDPRQRQRIFPLTSVSRTALWSTQPPVQWVPGVLSPGIKSGRDVTLITHPHLVPRLRVSRSQTSSPPSAFVACSGKALAFITYYDAPHCAVVCSSPSRCPKLLLSIVVKLCEILFSRRRVSRWMCSGKMWSECILGRLAWGCELDSTGSGQGPVAGCCECGDEPSGSCATELVS
jgi:hypothetical protein